MEASSLAVRSRLRAPRSRRLLAALGDDALVGHVRAGSEAAFEVVFDRYHRPILAFCRHMLGSLPEAEDAVQASFASAYSSLQRSSRPINLKPWLFTIARNRCLSVLRSRREESSGLDGLSTAGLAEQVERRADLRALVSDLRELPEQQRAALVLAELRSLSHAEIAEVLGCEANKVKSLVFQARSALIDSRRARETPCADIRAELSTLTRGSLRRSYLRKHLRACPGCTEFRAEVKRQRALLGLALPVVPSAALKHQTLSALGIGGGSAGSAGGIAAGLGTQAAIVKVAVVTAVGGAALGGATYTATHVPGPGAGAPAPVAAAAQAPGGPFEQPLSALLRPVAGFTPGPALVPRRHENAPGGPTGPPLGGAPADSPPGLDGIPQLGTSPADTIGGSGGAPSGAEAGQPDGGRPADAGAQGQDGAPENGSAGGGNGSAGGNSNAGGNGDGNANAFGPQKPPSGGGNPNSNAGGGAPASPGNSAAAPGHAGAPEAHGANLLPAGPAAGGNSNAAANANAGGNAGGNGGATANPGGNGNGNAGAGSNAGGSGKPDMPDADAPGLSGGHGPPAGAAA